MDRVGGTSADRLRWLLDSAQRDLFAIREEEWRDLQDQLQAFPVAFGYPIPAYSGSRRDTSPPGFSPEDIRVLLQEVKGGIRRFLFGPGWTFSIPRITRHVVRRRRGRNLPNIEGDLQSRVLMATADLLQTHGTRLKACPECNALFLPIKRQAYCSTKCSQRARTRRFRSAHRGELSERRHRGYEQRMKAVLGENVRVQRRGEKK